MGFIQSKVKKINYGFEVKKLTFNDLCLFLEKDDKLKRIKIVDLKVVNKKVQTYNLSEVENNNFFANKILVHNKFSE